MDIKQLYYSFKAGLLISHALYKHPVQTPCINALYKHPVQTPYTIDLYKRPVQMPCKNALYKRPVQTPCTNNLAEARTCNSGATPIELPVLKWRVVTHAGE